MMKFCSFSSFSSGVLFEVIILDFLLLKISPHLFAQFVQMPKRFCRPEVVVAHRAMSSA